MLVRNPDNGKQRLVEMQTLNPRPGNGNQPTEHCRCGIVTESLDLAHDLEGSGAPT
jgi:hypothetical protein